MGLAVCVAAAAVAMSGGRAFAQQGTAGRFQAPEWSADSVLTLFRVETADVARGDLGRARAFTILTRPDSISSAKRDSVAEGLERLALSSAEPATRRYALSYLAAAGNTASARPLPTAASRLARIYRASADRGARSAVLLLSWTLADRDGMVPLLREVAASAWQDGHSAGPMLDGSDPPTQAIHALSRMGAPGRAALAQLLRTGAVRSPRAREVLQRTLAQAPVQ